MLESALTRSQKRFDSEKQKHLFHCHCLFPLRGGVASLHPPKNTVLLLVHAHINPEKSRSSSSSSSSLTPRHAGPLTDDSWALASWAGLLIGGCACCDPGRQRWGAGTLTQLQGRTTESCSTHTHSSGCSLAYLQSPLKCGTLSEMIWHARFHLACAKCVFILRIRGRAKNYGIHVQEGHPPPQFTSHLPCQNVYIIRLHAYI